MAEQLKPSPPGYDFRSSDVQRAAIGPEEAGRIILQFLQEGVTADPTALLAAIVKTSQRRNCRMLIWTYSVGDPTLGNPEYTIKQIVPENPMRKALGFFLLVGLGSQAYWLLEPGPLQQTFIPVAQGLGMAKRSIKSSLVPGGGYQFFNPPTNAITAMVDEFGYNEGIILEGI
jgi:hypothetical protein